MLGIVQVVKPDMLFGKRGKNDLLALNVDYAQAETFITERMNKQVGSFSTLVDSFCIDRPSDRSNSEVTNPFDQIHIQHSDHPEVAGQHPVM